MGNCAARASSSRSRSRSRHAAAGLADDGVARVPPQTQTPEREEKGLGDEQVRSVEKGVEVKIRITRRQLRELLEKAGGAALEEKVAVEKMLADIVNAGQVVRRRPGHGEARWGGWRPALRTIPEDADEP